MNVVEVGISRQRVIETYVRYDAKKKNKPPIDFEHWNWDDANSLDEKLQAAGYKFGVISGYIIWNLVQLSYDDLGECAIVNCIFKGLPQTLGELTNFPAFDNWKPDKPPEWFETLEAGGNFPKEWAMILRPSVACEKPAKWYVEDGSGRAICFFRYLVRQKDQGRSAFGYLGIEIDPSSNFMKNTFGELYRRG